MARRVLVVALPRAPRPHRAQRNYFCLLKRSGQAQVERAVGLIAAAVNYKLLLDAQLIPPAVNRGRPLSMEQNRFLFSTTRIPGTEQVSVRAPYSNGWPGPSQERHIVVFFRGKAFRCGGDRVGRRRPGIHGDSGNRWVDKAVSLIVVLDGTAGLNVEHSCLDGTTVVDLVDELLGRSAEEHSRQSGRELQLIQRRRGEALGATEPLALYETPGWLNRRDDYLSTSSTASANVEYSGFGPTGNRCIGISYMVLPDQPRLYLSARRQLADEMRLFADELRGAVRELRDLVAPRRARRSGPQGDRREPRLRRR